MGYPTAAQERREATEARQREWSREARAEERDAARWAGRLERAREQAGWRRELAETQAQIDRVEARGVRAWSLTPAGRQLRRLYGHYGEVARMAGARETTPRRAGVDYLTTAPQPIGGRLEVTGPRRR